MMKAERSFCRDSERVYAAHRFCLPGNFTKRIEGLWLPVEKSLHASVQVDFSFSQFSRLVPDHCRTDKTTG